MFAVSQVDSHTMRSRPITGCQSALTGVCQPIVMTAVISTARLINRMHLGQWPPHRAVIGSELEQSRGDQARVRVAEQVQVYACVVAHHLGESDYLRRFHESHASRVSRSTTMIRNGDIRKNTTTNRVDGSPSAACHISVPRWTGGGASTLRGDLRLDLIHQSPQLFHLGWVVCDDAAQKVG